MKITNYYKTSNFTNCLSNSSLNNRIKTLILSIFKGKSNEKVDKKFEEKFMEGLTISTRTNNYDLLKKATILHKRFPQDQKISKAYKILVKERDQILNKAAKPIRTKEQANKALELINSRINLIDRITKQQMLDYPDEVNEILKEGTSMKALLYSIRDRVDTTHLSPIDRNSSKLRFNPTPRVRTYLVEDTIKIAKKQKSPSDWLMTNLEKDYIQDEQRVTIKL